MPTLNDTLKLVKEAHGAHNSTDKGNNTPYYWHLVRVMLRLQTDDIELLQIALLHDVVEDTHITLENLRELGYSNRVIEGVKWSSKNMFDLTFAEWMRAIGKEAPEDTILLKIADISDNLGFERMRGLMGRSPNFSHKNKKELDLRQKIDRLVEKKLRLHGEMGVYDRYYKGWNYMFENTYKLPLIKKVFIGDFCHLYQLKSLSSYLPKEEMFQYLTVNKINTWKISGILSILSDKTGQEYIGLKLPSLEIEPYINFLSEKIEPMAIDNQKIRDNENYHVTVINAAQFGALKKNKPQIIETFLNDHLHQSYDMFTYGIGKATSGNQSQAFFIVCENAELKQAREKLSLNNQDFHVTLAFTPKDVFGLPKNKNTIIYANDVLWKHFIEQFYPKQKKYRF